MRGSYPGMGELKPTESDLRQVAKHLSNPTLPENTGDHRYAARSLQHFGGRARERLRYQPATPRAGTRSTDMRDAGAFWV